MANTVVEIWEAALQESSRKTYGTGQRAYSRFMKTLRNGTHFPFKRLSLSQTELNIAFYIAFLLLEPRIKKASTIMNYASHVKSQFRSEGCPEEEQCTPFLGQIRKGIKNILPVSPDGRRPLLLPQVVHNEQFDNPANEDHRLLKFANEIRWKILHTPSS